MRFRYANGLAYLSGDRESALVVGYFRRFGLRVRCRPQRWPSSAGLGLHGGLDRAVSILTAKMQRPTHAPS